MPEETTEILLRVRTDQQSAQATAAALQAHQRDLATTVQRYKDVSNEADRMSTAVQYSATRMQDAISRSLDTQENKVESLEEVWQRYANKVNEVSEEVQRRQQEQGGGDDEGGGGGLQNLGFLRRVGSTLNRTGLGAVGTPLMDVGEIAQVTKGFSRLGDEIKPLISGLADVGGGFAPLTVAFTGLGGSMGAVAAAAGPVAIALVGVALALKSFNEQMDKGHAAIADAETRLTTYYTAIQTGTTESINAQLKELEIKLAIARELEQTNETALARAQEQDKKLGGIFQNQLMGIDTLVGPSKDLLAAYNDNKKAGDSLQATIDALKDAMNSGAVAANDAAAKELELQRARVGEANQFEKAALERQKDEDMVNAGQVDAIKTKVKNLKEQYKAEQEAMEYLIAHGDRSNKEVAAQIQKYYDDLATLGKEIDNLGPKTIATAEAIKAHSDALNQIIEAEKKLKDARMAAHSAIEEEANKGTMAAAAQFASDSQKLADAWIQRNDAMKKSDSDLATGRLSAYKDYEKSEKEALGSKNAKVEQINSNFMANEIKETQNFQDQLKRDDSKFAKDRLRLIEDLNDNLLKDAADGDVSAFIQAQKAAEKQLSRMDEDHTDADKQQTQDFIKQREVARKERDIQLADTEKTFRDEEQKRKDAYRDQLSALDQKHSAEMQAIQQAFVMQVAQLQSNFGGLHDLYAQYYAGQLADAQAYVSAMKANMQALFLGTTGGSLMSQSRGADTGSRITPAMRAGLGEDAPQGASEETRSYAVGGKLSHDGWIYGHAGEVITRAIDAKNKPQVVINMNNTVGDVFTQQKFDAARTEMENSIADRIEGLNV